MNRSSLQQTSATLRSLLPNVHVAPNRQLSFALRFASMIVEKAAETAACVGVGRASVDKSLNTRTLHTADEILAMFQSAARGDEVPARGAQALSAFVTVRGFLCAIRDAMEGGESADAAVRSAARRAAL